MKVVKVRRRQHKTNYKKRLTLLKSNKIRAVIRKSNRYLILQFVKSKEAQDKILESTNTKELLKFGWPENKKNSLKSISASYLAGYLLGKKSEGVTEVILDSGLIPNTKGSKVYAAVKGISDSGIKINHDEKVLPNEEKLTKSIGKEDFDKILEKINNGRI